MRRCERPPHNFQKTLKLVSLCCEQIGKSLLGDLNLFLTLSKVQGFLFISSYDCFQRVYIQASFQDDRVGHIEVQCLQLHCFDPLESLIRVVGRADEKTGVEQALQCSFSLLLCLKFQEHFDKGCTKNYSEKQGDHIWKLLSCRSFLKIITAGSNQKYFQFGSLFASAANQMPSKTV